MSFHEYDVKIGAAIREIRQARGMTQQALADLVGVKFQQMQKYETGANRVSGSRLAMIAKALKRPVSYFFREIEMPEAEPLPKYTKLERKLLETYRELSPNGQQAVRKMALEMSR